MKGIFGKGQMKCPSTMCVYIYTCFANGPFVGRNTSLLYFRPFVLATRKAVLLHFQYEGMLLMPTKESPMAAFAVDCVVACAWPNAPYATVWCGSGRLE